jgi:acyl carrier protein
MTLLAGDVPPVVVVNLPGQRLDVPGMAWADEPPRPSPQATSTAPVPPVQPAPATRDDEDSGEDSGDEDSVTAAVRGFWTAALGITDIGPDDDFFDLGGNSLSAVQVVARIKERFGADLGAGAMFELSTIRLLTNQLRG